MLRTVWGVSVKHEHTPACCNCCIMCSKVPGWCPRRSAGRPVALHLKAQEERPEFGQMLSCPATLSRFIVYDLKKLVNYLAKAVAMVSADGHQTTLCWTQQKVQQCSATNSLTSSKTKAPAFVLRPSRLSIPVSLALCPQPHQGLTTPLCVM